MTDQHQPESCGQLYTRQTQTAEELGTGYSGQLYTVQNTQRKLGVDSFTVTICMFMMYGCTHNIL